jgi:hypothetical protein
MGPLGSFPVPSQLRLRGRLSEKSPSPRARIEAPSPFALAVSAGFEPAAPRFEVSYSIRLSYGTVMPLTLLRCLLIRGSRGWLRRLGEKRARSALAFELSAESYRAAMSPEWMSQAPCR